MQAPPFFYKPFYCSVFLSSDELYDLQYKQESIDALKYRDYCMILFYKNKGVAVSANF